MWIFLALTSAVADSLQNVYYKKSALEISPVLMVWSVLVISSVFFSPLFLFGIPQLNQVFWIAFGLRIVLDSLAFTLYVKGVQLSPLHLTIPMMSLSPLFTILSGYFINGGLPSVLGLLGIFCTVAGVYLLSFDYETKNLLLPVRSIFKQKGVLYVATAAILWSVILSLQRLAIDNSNYFFYTAFFQICWAICFTPVVYFFDRKGFFHLTQFQFVKKLTPAGFLDALKMISQNIAITLTLPAYVISIGNTSILLSSLWGRIFFREKIEQHVFPIFLILLGVTFITFA